MSAAWPVSRSLCKPNACRAMCRYKSCEKCAVPWGARQGVIITTSDFSKGAREEAERTDAAPVALVNGEHLIDLLIEHGVGVSRTAHEVLTLEELPGPEA